LEFPQRICI